MNKHNRNRFTDNRNQTSSFPREKGWARSNQVKGVRGTKLLGTINMQQTYGVQHRNNMFYNNFIWKIICKNIKLL